MEIIPAIIPQTFDDLEDKLAAVAKSVPLVQIDVLDGSLVALNCWPYQSASKRDMTFDAIIREEKGFPFWEELEFEAHLMVREPERIIADWIAAGAARIIVEWEGVKDIKKCIDEVAGRVPLGIALGLETPYEGLADIVDSVEVIQCMGWNSSNLGRQGKPLDERVFEKIRTLRKLFPNHPISVDGGVNLENAQKLRDAGASRLVVGSALWEGGSVRENLVKFKQL